MTYDILEYKKDKPKGVIKGKKSFKPEDVARSFRQYFFPNEGLPNKELTTVQANGLQAYNSKSKTSNRRPEKTLAAAYFLSAYMRRRQYSRFISGNSVSHNFFLNKKNYKHALCGLGLYYSVTHTWVNHEDCFLAPSRELTAKEKKSCLLYALLSERNRCTTAFLQETEIQTKNGKIRNGGLVRAELNPFDETLFHWNGLSPAAQKALNEYRHYCYDIVNWEHYQTAAGRGVWGGHFLYERTKNGLDIENKKTGGGFPLPQPFKDAREELRLEVEKIALELCF